MGMKVSLFRCLKRLGINPERAPRIRQYWRNIRTGDNAPIFYLDKPEKSKFLVGIVRELIGREARILEIGCNAGRNLHYLFQAGYQNLQGIEVNEAAIELLRETYPELESCPVKPGLVEELLPRCGNGEFDLIFTMSVLMHLHPKSKPVFVEMTRVAQWIITIEEEESKQAWAHFPRNYRGIFTSLGMHQVKQLSCDGIPGLNAGYRARVFRK